MLLLIIIFGLIIAAIVLAIKYFKAYAKLMSHKSYNRAAQQEMKHIKYRDPKITCDYCGSIIDTSMYKVCPHCGAAYDKDEEWIDRFNQNQDWVDQMAEQEAEYEIERARREAAIPARKLKKVLIALGCIFGGLIVLGVIILLMGNTVNYLIGNDLNEYESDDYESVNYYVHDGGIVADSDGITVSVEGVYKSDYRYRLGYHIVNDSGQDIHLIFRGAAVNSYAYEFTYFSEDIKKDADVTVYENINGFGTEDFDYIESLVFYGIEFRDMDYNKIYINDDCVKLTTSVDQGTEPVLSEGKVLFENDVITVNEIGLDKSAEEYLVEVLNKTGDTVTVNIDGAKFNGKDVDIYGLYNVIIPAGCLLKDAYVYTYDADLTKMTDDDVFSINISVKDEEHPEISCSTGYIELS